MLSGMGWAGLEYAAEAVCVFPGLSREECLAVAMKSTHMHVSKEESRCQQVLVIAHIPTCKDDCHLPHFFL